MKRDMDLCRKILRYVEVALELLSSVLTDFLKKAISV